jgi:thiamine phosphate synthase YjbQ (UPF0047 family)
MSWSQKNFTLPARSRGSYLITDHVLSEVPEIRDYKVGMLNLFVQHTSCALSLNENWDDDVRADMSDALDRIAPSDRKGNLYRHSAEGDDDMPVCSIRVLFIYKRLGTFRCPFRGAIWASELAILLFAFVSLSRTLLVVRSSANLPRLILNLPSLAPPSTFPFRTVDWLRAHGRVFGTWNSVQVDTAARLSQQFRAKRHDSMQSTGNCD